MVNKTPRTIIATKKVPYHRKKTREGVETSLNLQQKRRQKKMSKKKSKKPTPIK